MPAGTCCPASRLWLSTGDVLYSNRSRPMFTILEDTCGRHDFTLTPCSKRMFEIIYGETEGRPGCEGNLAAALAPYGIGIDRIPVAFNIFMNVTVDGTSGEVAVLPPLLLWGLWAWQGHRWVFVLATAWMVLGLALISLAGLGPLP